MSSYRRKKHHKHDGRGLLGLLNLGLWTLALVASFILSFVIYSYGLLNFKALNWISIAAMAVFLLVTLLLIVFKKLKIVTTLLLTVFVCGSLTGLYVIKSLIDVSDRMNMTARFSEVEMGVFVPMESSLSDISEVRQLLVPASMDQENINQLLLDIETKKKVEPSLVETESYASAYEDLLGGKAEAMILNSAYASLLESQHSDYSQKIKKIYSYNIKKEVVESDKPKRTVTDGSVMNIYISGVDTYGPISTVSRSDVNILMTINKNTNQILLTTTPRDSYVPIAGGGQNQKDKLTHAGIYGVESSIGTLENLYDLPIDYYARINFTSFLNLIDLLGGITVENDQAFSVGGYDFPVGLITMDSEMALRFVRERYSLEHGDNDRGLNQTKVIAAIIKKLTSVNAIANYQSIINGIGDSVQTNMPLVTMMALANDQLASGRSYTITSQSLEGRGSTGELPSYAMPGSALYMLEIDRDNLATVTANIKATMEAGS